MPIARTRPRRKRRANEEPLPAFATESATPAQAQQVPVYARGHATVGVPLLDGGAAQLTPQEEENPATAAKESEEISTRSSAAVSEGAGEGERIHGVGYSVTLQGRTDADYDSSFRQVGVRTTAGTGCDGCTGGDECVRVRGTLVSTYRVTTTVTLPSVNDFPNLTPCQQQRVRNAIRNVLAPHEQHHVAAFRTYNGTTRQRFDMTICRDAFDAAMQDLHNAEQSARQAAAQAQSDALDPFSFDVDIDCEEPPPRQKRSAADIAAPNDQEIEA